MTPFPGTPLYRTLKQQNRLRFENWWLDENYRYNDVPFNLDHMSHKDITRLCVKARKRFYSWRSIVKRGIQKPNRSDGFMFRNFFPINFTHGAEVNKRNGYPLGDENWQGKLLEAD